MTKEIKSQIDNAKPVQTKEKKEDKKSALQKVLDHFGNDIAFFHDAYDACFAEINFDTHKELHEINSKRFKSLINKIIYQIDKRALGKPAQDDIINTLAAKALYDGARIDVKYRVNSSANGLALDLCNNKWEYIKITKDGWNVTAIDTQLFCRSAEMNSLPHPNKTGDIDLLWNYLNIKNDDDKKLVISWLVSVCFSDISYAHMVLNGGQGCAKSSATMVLKSIVDPHQCLLRSLPSSEQDLFIHAKNNHILTYDNVSGFNQKISDAFCKLSTGGAYSKRALYTDNEESIINAQCPVILNGISDFVTKQDLIDRSIILELQTISSPDRKPEREFWDSFKSEHPKILAGLLDCVSGALAKLEDVKQEKHQLPRMTDFAQIGIALERHLKWPEGSFLTAYNNNKHASMVAGLETEPVALALQSLMNRDKRFTGTPTGLLKELTENHMDDFTGRYSQKWPKAAHTLTGIIKRLAPALRSIGIGVKLGDDAGRSSDARGIEIYRIDQSSVTSVMDQIHDKEVNQSEF